MIYIPRDEWLKMIRGEPLIFPDTSMLAGMDFMDEIKKRFFEDVFEAIQNGELVRVKRGRWIEYGMNKDNTHSIWCSACNASIKSKGHANSIYTKKHFVFCPNCGAKMEVEE